MRNELIGLWEVERYGSDSFVDVDYVCVYGLRPRDGTATVCACWAGRSSSARATGSRPGSAETFLLRPSTVSVAMPLLSPFLLPDNRSGRIATLGEQQSPLRTAKGGSGKRADEQGYVSRAEVGGSARGARARPQEPRLGPEGSIKGSIPTAR